MKKKWISKFLIFNFIFVLIVGLFNFVVDPLQQYRKANFYKPHFTNARYLSPGLAKNYNYDSIIVGSSMAENFILSNVEEKLKFNRVIKFAAGGATAYEIKNILSVSFNDRKINNVLLGLDFYAFSGRKDRLLHGTNSLPLYLYDNNYLNDYMYVFNIDTTKLAFKTFLLQKSKSKSIELDYNKMFQWQHRYRVNDFSENKILSMWNKSDISFNKDFKLENFKLEKFKESFLYNLLPIIKENQNTKFDIFYPPYSILAQIDSKNKNFIKENLLFKKYIYETLSKYLNVKLYDFQIAKDVTYNLNNYRDFTHYHQKINNWILEQIRDNKYLVTKDNYKEYSEELSKQVNEYEKLLEKKEDRKDAF